MSQQVSKPKFVTFMRLGSNTKVTFNRASIVSVHDLGPMAQTDDGTVYGCAVRVRGEEPVTVLGSHDELMQRINDDE